MSTLENHHSLIRTRTVSRSISFTPTDDEQSPTHKQTLSVYLSLSLNLHLGVHLHISFK